MLFNARCFSILLVVFLLNSASQAQELWGIANSNYAGTMGHELNPASIVGAPFNWEIHVLSTNQSVMNNYLYLKKGSKAIRAFSKGNSIAPDRITYENNTKDKSANASTFAKIPAFMFSHQKWGVGFHVSSRFALSARGIPYHLANFMKEGFDYSPQQKIDYQGGNAKVAGMNWHEAGVTGGVALLNQGQNYLTAGITLNYLYGLNGIYLLINDINYNVQADTLWQIYLAKAEYGHATVDPSDPKSPGALTKKGSGIGGSIGIQYYHNRFVAKPCDKSNKKKYDYKIGFSIVDIGRINFTESAAKFEFNDVSTDWFGIDTVKFGGVGNSDSIFNSQFYNNLKSGQTATSFPVWLPAAAALQIDYAFTPSIYLNLSVMQRIPINDYTIRRANQVALTLRYERRFFEIAVPYSFYDYYHHRLGLCLRFGVLTVGTDMIGSYTGLTDTYGVDFYFGIKFQNFKKCTSKNKSQRPSKNNYGMDCFKEL